MKGPKVMIFPLSAVGHLNPILKVAFELIKSYNATIIIYSIENFKAQIEKIGAEYRQLEKENYDELQKSLKLNHGIIDLVDSLIQKGLERVNNHMMRIVEDIEKEKPDVILHDTFAFHARYAIRVLHKRHSSDKSTSKSSVSIEPSYKLPKVFIYWTSPINKKNLYPNSAEMDIALKLTFYEKLKSIYVVIKHIIRAKLIAYRYNIEYRNPFEEMAEPDPNYTNIVFIFPEFHPKSHLFPNNTIFVGACIEEKGHVSGPQEEKMDEVAKLIEKFPIINPPDIKDFFNITKVTYGLNKKRVNRNNGEKLLCYVSLGTVFNNDINLYKKIISAFEKFDDDDDDDDAINNDIIVDSQVIKGKDLSIIIAVGHVVYEEIMELCKKKQLNIPENVIIATYVPQLEILKRASVFITHCGMNSTSESIHYGVPMICIPLNSDQYLNAYRVSTELGMGIELNRETMTSEDLRNALHKIIENKSYAERTNLYSFLSRRYVGHKNFTDKVMENLKKSQ